MALPKEARDHVALWPEGSAEIAGLERAAVPQLTVYPAHTAQPTSAVIVCPGGGYARRAEHEAVPVARWLNELGITACVLDYRVAPHRHPAPLWDAQRALRLVRHRAAVWNIRPDRVGILGFSAGGHLAATVGTKFDPGDPQAADPIARESSRPDALVLCYPVISFGSFTHTGSMRNLLGDDPSDDLRRDLSAELHVTSGTPPTFLWHTANDPAVSVEHSLVFASALHRNGVPFALHVFPEGAHGAGMAEGQPEVSSWTDHCANFLARHGF